MSQISEIVRKAIAERAEPIIHEAIERHIDDAVRRVVANHPRFQFVKAMQLQMLGCDPKMDPREAWSAAVDALKAFCEDEGCEFGDPRFDWSRDAAVTLIHEYEIHHWESAA